MNVLAERSVQTRFLEGASWRCIMVQLISVLPSPKLLRKSKTPTLHQKICMAKLLLQEAVTLSYYDRSRDRSAKNLVVVGVPNIEHDAVLVAPPT